MLAGPRSLDHFCHHGSQFGSPHDHHRGSHHVSIHGQRRTALTADSTIKPGLWVQITAFWTSYRCHYSSPILSFSLINLPDLPLPPFQFSICRMSAIIYNRTIPSASGIDFINRVFAKIVQNKFRFRCLPEGRIPRLAPGNAFAGKPAFAAGAAVYPWYGMACPA